MKKLLKRLSSDVRGTSSVEMGLICALIVLAMLTALQDFAAGSISMWNTVTTRTSDAISGAAA
ncbi:MAG: Flp family type IVb pilin [Novosphingobium sp.]